MRERENLDKAISFHQKGASTYSLWADMWAQNVWQWLLLTSPWCSCTYPLCEISQGQRFTNSLNWLIGLGYGLGHMVWQAIFRDNGSVQESGKRNRNSLNNASHLWWQPEELKKWSFFWHYEEVGFKWKAEHQLYKTMKQLQKDKRQGRRGELGSKRNREDQF
jgi:hypothetical protein